MSVLLAVDPGIRVAGAAIFVAGSLHRASLVVNPASAGRGAAACRDMAQAIHRWFASAFDLAPQILAVEWPRVYASRIRAGETREDPNDLLALCGVDAALAALYDSTTVREYAPSEWKGQAKKSACHHLVNSRLLPLERERLGPLPRGERDKRHNVWDAVGIGLKALGRFEPERVITY